ncbi:serine hydrolase domain-containing protein [Candidatus Latescibacterota bacterium]
MKKIILLIILFIFSFSLRAQTPRFHENDNPLETKLDSVVNKYSMKLLKDNSMAGLSLGIYNNGETFFYNYGSIEKDKQIIPTQNTIYEIGSITKTFTGILLAHAVLENRINLNDDIRTYLKNYDNLQYDGIPIKVINLANHSSGLPEDLYPEEIQNIENPSMFDIINVFEGDKGALFLRDLHKVKPDTALGSKIQYSNTGVIILGIILENVYGTSYSELIKEYFTRPLGMNNTETVYFESDTDNYTKGYDKKGNIMPHITFQIAGAAGGLKSTAYDMILYIKENIKEMDEAIKLSHESTISIDGQEIGLGWQMCKNTMGDKQLWHDGGEPGFSSYIAIIPEKNIGIICLTNQRGRQNQLTNLSEKIIENIVEK